MISEKRKKRKKEESLGNFIFLCILTFLILLIVGVFVYKNVSLYRQRSRLSQKVELLQEKITVLEEREEYLEEGLSEEKWEDFVEQEARERLNLRKEGEEAVSFVLPEIEEEEIEEETKRSSWHPLSWWEWIKDIF